MDLLWTSELSGSHVELIQLPKSELSLGHEYWEWLHLVRAVGSTQA